MKSTLTILLLAVLATAFSVSTYRIKEGEQAVITRFGEPVKNPVVDEAGLKFKVPFITEVNRLDKRILSWDGTTQDMVTAEQRNISIDTTARWRIEDALAFYKRMGNEESAQSRLDDMLHEVVQTIIASTDLSEIVRSKDWEIDEEQMDKVVEAEGDEKQLDKKVQTGREELVKRMQAEADKQVEDFGISLIDLRIKRINYVDQVQSRVFERMISERKRIATMFRQEGAEEADRIRAKADRQVSEIRSEAKRKGDIIRGAADAEATRIYSEAYDKDPEFFAFKRTLDSYEKSLDENSVLMLSTGSDYFRYLKGIGESGKSLDPEESN
ncbi:MAG: protease modulator HflC [Opitutales bacterium]